MAKDLHEHIDGMKATAGRLIKNLAGTTSKQVRSPRLQQDCRSFSMDYFREVRPVVCAALDEPILAPLDDLLQELLEISQRNSLRSRYRDVLKGIQKTLNVVEIAAVTRTQDKQPDKANRFDEDDAQIIVVLTDLVPTAAASYSQACSDLRDTNRTSFRGTAAELRESLRETLDHLAPDDVVMRQVGFRLEAQQTKPTMKQKARFILKSRGVSKTVYETPETAIETVEERIGALARSIYNRSSLSAHVTTNLKEVKQIKAYIDVIFRELLELS